MGHDITACKALTSERNDQVAYLRRAAWDELNGTIYAALQCEELSGGVSGGGSEAVFTHDELVRALGRIPAGEDTEREREFLRKCIAAGGDVRIEFW